MEALAIEGMARVRLGNDMWLKRKVDEFRSLEAAMRRRPPAMHPRRLSLGLTLLVLVACAPQKLL